MEKMSLISGHLLLVLCSLTSALPYFIDGENVAHFWSSFIDVLYCWLVNRTPGQGQQRLHIFVAFIGFSFVSFRSSVAVALLPCRVSLNSGLSLYVLNVTHFSPSFIAVEYN